MPYKDPEKRRQYQSEYQSRPAAIALRFLRRDKELEGCKVYRELNAQKVRAVQSAWQKSTKGKFTHQRRKAAERGIDWNLSFEDWWNWWMKTGLWEQRGSTKGRYCMCRFGDVGPYSLDNIYVGLHGDNVSIAQKRRWGN